MFENPIHPPCGGSDWALKINVIAAAMAAITLIVRAQITNPILRTADGSDFLTFDEYYIYQLLSAVK